MSDDSSMEEVPMLAREERVDAGYPGSGYVPDGDERNSVEGVVKTASGHEYSITLKTIIEFCGGLFFWFFGILATVTCSTTPIVLRNTGVSALGAYQADNSTGVVTNTTTYSAVHGSYAFLNEATGLTVQLGDQTVIANPLATPLTAMIWAGLFFLVVSALPGISLNPWVSLNHFWFAWKRGGKLSFTHMKHLTVETFCVIVAQFGSGIVAVICVYFVMNNDTTLIGETLPSTTLSNDAKVILYEAIGSFLFMVLINLYSRPRRNVSAMQQAGFISAGLFFVILCFNGFTGASLNFVRTFAPALVRSIFSGVPMRVSVLWYLIGQSIGFGSAGLLAWFVNSAYVTKLFRVITSSSKND
jgi:glycerol uptake facilitator-like aquaporin